MHYTESRRIENAVVSLARQRGLDGDPFADVPDNWRSVGNPSEEAAIEELWLDARRQFVMRSGRVSDEALDLIKKMARSVVLTRSPDLTSTRHTTMEQACHDYIAELAGDEVPATRQTWRRDDTPERIKRARSTAR